MIQPARRQVANRSGFLKKQGGRFAAPWRKHTCPFEPADCPVLQPCAAHCASHRTAEKSILPSVIRRFPPESTHPSPKRRKQKWTLLRRGFLGNSDGRPASTSMRGEGCNEEDPTEEDSYGRPQYFWGLIPHSLRPSFFSNTRHFSGFLVVF